jgi:uncharacterized coiled-coil protein SlyX
MEEKRVRAKNFTENEKNALFEIVTTKYKGIIENKQSDAVTIAKRNLAWQEIAKKLNAQSQIGKRSAKQIHALYDNLKKTARSNLHSDKVSVYLLLCAYDRKVTFTSSIKWLIIIFSNMLTGKQGAADSPQKAPPWMKKL